MEGYTGSNVPLCLCFTSDNSPVLVLSIGTTLKQDCTVRDTGRKITMSVIFFFFFLVSGSEH